MPVGNGTVNTSTTVLIVGAGPTGLAAALSLVKTGFRDFIIVDAVPARELATRAITIQAATLEALDTLNCAEPLVQSGTKGRGTALCDRTSPFLVSDMESLAPHTPYPYVLLISQSTTEEILEGRLRDLGVEILRPERAIGLVIVNSGDLEVTFESGRRITARYVIGADGSRSVIRQMAGVTFLDPDGENEKPEQMVLGDVTFSAPSPFLPTDLVTGISSTNKVFILIPLPREPGSAEDVYRIGFNVPSSAGPIPSNIPVEFMQRYLNEVGPLRLSSDPTVNPNPIRISKILWSSRFRVHAAIADRFMVQLGDKKGSGIVLLVGDAAHIHSPAGGQGMNLGLRDAIFLGPVLAAHIRATADTIDEHDRQLEEYALTRRVRALNTIKLSKRLMEIMKTSGCESWIDTFLFFFIRFLGKIPFVRRRMAWNLSGLGNR